MKQIKCPYCHPYTDENANYLTLKLASLLNDPKNGQKPLYVCRAFKEVRCWFERNTK